MAAQNEPDKTAHGIEQRARQVLDDQNRLLDEGYVPDERICSTRRTVLYILGERWADHLHPALLDGRSAER